MVGALVIKVEQKDATGLLMQEMSAWVEALEPSVATHFESSMECTATTSLAAR